MPENCYSEQFYIARLTPTRRRRQRFGTTGSRVSLELRQFPVETRDVAYVHMYSAYVLADGWRLRYEFNLQAGSGALHPGKLKAIRLISKLRFVSRAFWTFESPAVSKFKVPSGEGLNWICKARISSFG